MAKFMEEILNQVNDSRLEKIIDCIDRNSKESDINEQFKEVQDNFPEYSIVFLWLLSYPYEHAPTTRNYIEKNYQKFKQFLDSGFPTKLAKKDCFESHMWEMILCDILSCSGKLKQKSADGADFLLTTKEGVEIQVEATCPDESEDLSLRSERPPHDLKSGELFTRGGKIDDLELPILLRAVNGFDSKSNKYNKSKPLIIAINTHKAVGMISNDDYILRRMLFGLGNFTITRKSDDVYKTGLEYNPNIRKPEKEPFIGARFLNKDNAHVSGVIYTSQNPIGLIPNSWGWNNSGVFYASNPYATHKVDIDFPFFKTMICNEKEYRVDDVRDAFNGSFDF